MFSNEDRISIHAAQEGCDKRTCYPSGPREHFNPRSPRGLRLDMEQKAKKEQIFQSTQPKRAATNVHVTRQDRENISIHAAQEGCDLDVLIMLPELRYISIHAAQEGCDKRA